MNDTFVPLMAATVKPRENGFVSLAPKSAPLPSIKPAANPSVPARSTEACAKPTVTLQRNGDIVTAIRVQCGCGQVIELACVY